MNNLVLEKLNEADKIIIGLSGGADSVALTHILYKLFTEKKIFCIHINHQIRGEEAMRDENFVREFCKTFGIDLAVKTFDVPKIAKEKNQGTEECARNIRYECFHSLCGENDVIATAHNQDDNAETVIFNLVRGTGLKGLAGIPFVRGKVLRPVLDKSRKEIEQYCKENKLEFIHDSTNFENEYSRNKIRNIVFPVLREINSKATENIMKSSEILTCLNENIEETAEKILEKAEDEYGLKTEVLLKNSDYLISETIKLFLLKKKINSYEYKHIKEIINCIKNTGAVVLPGDIQVSVKQKRLTVYSKKELYTEEYSEKNVILQENLQNNEKINNLLFKNLIDCDKINDGIIIGTKKNGDVFRQAKRNVSKTLKKLFNEAKIPAHLRDKLIVLRDGDKIVYIENFGVAQDYCVDEKTKRYYSVLIENIRRT
ncbi:MAG: tRNA lysidine(34) synthetase TilS [Clostridia bacterium]